MDRLFCFRYWIIICIIFFAAAGILTWQYFKAPQKDIEFLEDFEESQESEEDLIPLAPEVIFTDYYNVYQDYYGREFRLQGCFEPKTCYMSRMAGDKCDIGNLEHCCDCIKNNDHCLVVDLQLVPKEQLVDVRKSEEIKYYVEIIGRVIMGSKMRPVQIEANDLKILGDCP